MVAVSYDEDDRIARRRKPFRSNRTQRCQKCNVWPLAIFCPDFMVFLMSLHMFRAEHSMHTLLLGVSV